MSEYKETLLTKDEIENAVKGVAYRIHKDYEGEELLIVCILKGAFIFCADLVRNLDLPCEIDFISASSYGSSTVSSGNVRIHKDIEYDIAGRHVILVEDIVDSGLTLSRLKSFFLSRNPASLKICCLLDKKERRQTDIEVDYSCFTIPDAFVVGYGLDYDSRYRNLPDIMVLDESVYNH
ncbi:MAG: hypoxanthine phosphoribosyltransferase [Clostridiales bacterium]|nr:hypoxanthine phosphoribosyltransferase [Clostridiales bacterium]